MITGTCHCGTVEVEVPGPPEALTLCNCSSCRRYGALWAYFPIEAVRITGHPAAHHRVRLGRQNTPHGALPLLRLRHPLGAAAAQCGQQARRQHAQLPSGRDRHSTTAAFRRGGVLELP